MRKIAGILACAAFVLMAGANAALAAPRELYGKSVVISWTEERMQRTTGETQFRAMNFSGQLSVYVSDAGRLFNRITLTNPRGKSGNADRVGNTEGRNITFQGDKMVALINSGVGGAWRIVATFPAGFGGCSAEAVRGKESGAGVITAKSIISPGVTVEIQSVKTSGVGCSVRSGNVFGSE